MPENIMDSTFQVEVKPARVFFTDIDRVYPMVATPRGLALIINNETFACPSFYTQRYVVYLHFGPSCQLFNNENLPVEGFIQKGFHPGTDLPQTQLV